MTKYFHYKEFAVFICHLKSGAGLTETYVSSSRHWFLVYNKLGRLLFVSHDIRKATVLWNALHTTLTTALLYSRQNPTTLYRWSFVQETHPGPMTWGRWQVNQQHNNCSSRVYIGMALGSHRPSGSAAHPPCQPCTSLKLVRGLYTVTWAPPLKKTVLWWRGTSIVN